jgi:OmpA-OmpF porin, OOP family
VEQQRESPTMNDSGGVNRSLALVVAILLVRCAPFAGATRGGDHDGDLINDLQDACPRASGLLTDDPATSGCPPPPDADHDNILEFADACPNEPGEASEDPSMNGCPDADHDDVIDHNDACPNVAGPRTIDARTNGCPDSDTHRSR